MFVTPHLHYFMRLPLLSLLCFLCAATSSLVHANDGVFYGCSGIDEPLKPTRVRIHHEWLSIRYVQSEVDEFYGEYEADVNVRFHFWNPDDTAVTLPVGFVVPRGFGDYGIDDYNKPAISRFVTQSNGKVLKHTLFERTCDTCLLRKPVIIREDDQYFDANEGGHPDHVFISSMLFKPGLNVVTHSYRQRLSTGIMVLSEFYYTLTTAQHWAGQVIDTFECSISPTANVVCFVDGMDMVPAPSIVGIGKIEPKLIVKHDTSESYTYDNRGNLAIRIVKADIHFRTLGFRPTENLSVTLFDRWRFQDPEHFADGDRPTVHPLLYDVYAAYGFVFKDPKVQRWYESQPWYIADSNCTPQNIQLAARDRESIKDLLNDHKDDPAILGRPPLKRK